MDTELTTQAEWYNPAVRETGEYYDACILSQFTNGLRCPCAQSNAKQTPTVFKQRGAFVTHCKSKRHQDWLQNLNQSRHNLVAQHSLLQETVKNQQHMISSLSNEIARLKHVIVEQATQQFGPSNHSSTNNNTSEQMGNLISLD